MGGMTEGGMVNGGVPEGDRLVLAEGCADDPVPVANCDADESNAFAAPSCADGIDDGTPDGAMTAESGGLVKF